MTYIIRSFSATSSRVTTLNIVRISTRSFSATMSVDDGKKGFDTIALHGGYTPDKSAVFGLGHGAPRGVPLYRTTPYVFKDTEHAANLFALKELGNIYSRLMNPVSRAIPTFAKRDMCVQ
jgi:hypothetical protein